MAIKSSDASDIYEQNDLAAKMPEKVEELDARLTEYLKSVNAQMPKLNPDYDPDKPQTSDDQQRGGRGGGVGRNRQERQRQDTTRRSGGQGGRNRGQERNQDNP
ncbi:MAG: hypothetical protein KAR47_12100 [Planctomycetes bacterium]|nr:hypothetical protein [Planctomycetota bacterium]